MALAEYQALKNKRKDLSRAIQEIDQEIRDTQRQLSRNGARARGHSRTSPQQNSQLERVGLSAQINQLRAKRAQLSAQLRRVKRDLRAYDPK